MNAFAMRTLDRFLTGLLLLTAAVAAGCGDNPVEVVDDRPPDFVLEDLDGNPFQLSSTEGKVVVLHFFAPWCPSCQEEAPVVNRIHERFKDEGVVVLGIAEQAESMEQIRAYQATYEVPYRILVDTDGKVGFTAWPQGYDIPGFPTTFIIDREVTLSGPYRQMNEEQFTSLIEQVL